MVSLRTFVAPLLGLALCACGPAKTPSDPSSGGESTAGTSSSAEAASGEATKPSEAGGGEASGGEASGDEGTKTDAPKTDAPKAEEKESEATVLARDFLKSGGRRIGYSATKKMFAYPMEQRNERGFGLDVGFVGEDGAPRDRMRICQLGECEEHLDEKVKELMPKLTSRLESEGYIAIRGIGWPQGRDDLEVSTLSAKLKYTKGKFEMLREGKPAAAIRQVGNKRLPDTLFAIFIVPDSKFLGMLAPPGPEGKGLIQEFYLFKLP